MNLFIQVVKKISSAVNSCQSAVKLYLQKLLNLTLLFTIKDDSSVNKATNLTNFQHQPSTGWLAHLKCRFFSYQLLTVVNQLSNLALKQLNETHILNILMIKLELWHFTTSALFEPTSWSKLSKKIHQLSTAVNQLSNLALKTAKWDSNLQHTCD